jgi:DNA-binding XRE family transcriptional regulator
MSAGVQSVAWGLALAQDERGQGVPLVRLANAARVLAASLAMREGDAISRLADLWAAPGGFAVYLLQPGDCYAVPVTDAHVFRVGVTARRHNVRPATKAGAWSATDWWQPSRPHYEVVPAREEVHELRGPAGAIELLRSLAAQSAGAAALDSKAALISWLALPAVDVSAITRELRGEVPEPLRLVPAAAVSSSGEEAPTAAVVDADPKGGGLAAPDGVTWSRPEGCCDAWTDGEREAMFRARHIGKVSSNDLAKAVGVSRQAIDAQIGGARVLKSKNPKWPAVWSPSTELLRECGAPLQALQAVAASVA